MLRPESDQLHGARPPSIRRKASIATCVRAIAGLAILAFLAPVGLGSAVDEPPRPASGEPAAAALQALRRAWLDEIDDLMSVTRPLAIASDSYDFVARPTLPYVADHYDRKRLAAERIDTVLIINRRRTPLFWRRVGDARNRGFPDAEAFLARLPPLSSPDGTGTRTLAGAVRLARGPSLVVAVPISPANGQGKARGWLITARALDAAEWRAIEDRAHVTVAVLDPTEAGLPAGADAALKQPLEPVVRAENGGTRGLMAVPDLAGRPLRVFSVLLPGPAATAKRAQSVSAGRYGRWLAFAVVVAGAGSALWILLRRRNRAPARAPELLPRKAARSPATTDSRPMPARAPAAAAANASHDLAIATTEAEQPTPPEPEELDSFGRGDVKVAPSAPRLGEAPVADLQLDLGAADLAMALAEPDPAESPEPARGPGLDFADTTLAAPAPRNCDLPDVEATFDFEPNGPAAATPNIPVTAREQLRIRLAEASAAIRYQPQVELRTGWVTGVEAVLCAVESSEHRTATELVAELEAAGLGSELAAQWLEEACVGRRTWLLQSPYDAAVSIPVSTDRLEDAAFATLVREILTRVDLPPHFLELEVVGWTLGGTATSRATLAELHDSGVLIAVNCAGGTLADPGLLTLVPVAKLLIDPRPVRDADSVPRAAQLASLIEAARNLGVDVCATGIDSADLATNSDWHGCTMAQGWVFSPIVEADQIPLLIRESGVRRF